MIRDDEVERKGKGKGKGIGREGDVLWMMSRNGRR